MLGLPVSLALDQPDPANTVNIKDFLFQPSILTVPAGTTVTWHNQDGVQHTVTSDTQGLFDSGALAPGKKFSFTFTAPGSYMYHCNIHTSMHGEIAVSGSVMQEASRTSTKNFVPPGQMSKETNQERIQGLVPEAIQSTIPETAPSFIQGTAQGIGQAISQSKKPSWSEKPVSVQTTSNVVTQQGTALQSTLGQSIGQSQVLKFSQYFQITPQKPSAPLSAPIKYELTGHEPTMLYFGSSQKSVPYSQYQSYLLSSGLNSLWIQGASSWTQYATVPLGSSLSLIGASSTSGYGYLYEVYPDGTLDKNGYYFYPYNRIGFYADSPGQHLLFYVIDGQPSNIIVIDVVAYQPPPPIYNYASITISSSWLRGYSVYIDGSYQAYEGTTGEAPGVVTISVPGNQYHTVAVYGSGFSFSDYRYFNAGWAYTLNV